MRTDWTIYPFDTLASTQDTAKDYLAEGRPLPFAIQAATQTKGRGRSGNQWSSPKGNLYASLTIDVGQVRAKDAGQYSFLTAVALMRTFAEYGINDARNKWPNDILVTGKKIAGILLESDLTPDGYIHALIIGVGVNLSEAPEGAASLHHFVHQETPENFLRKFIAQLQSYLDIMTNQGFAPIHEEWLAKAYGIGTEIRVRLPSETFYGEFLGLNETGALLVRVGTENSPRIIHSGEVFFEQKEA